MASSDFPDLAESVPRSDDPTEERPKIFNFLVAQGRNVNTKKFLNQLLIRVALNMKDEFRNPHQPVTISGNVRALFAMFKSHGVDWKVNDFKKWDGALVDVIEQTWNKHKNRQPEYGKKHRKESQIVDRDWSQVSKLSQECQLRALVWIFRTTLLNLARGSSQGDDSTAVPNWSILVTSHHFQ